MRAAILALALLLPLTPEVLFAAGHLMEDHHHTVDLSSPVGVVSRHETEWSAVSSGHHDHQFFDAAWMTSTSKRPPSAVTTSADRVHDRLDRAQSFVPPAADFSDTGPPPPLPLRI